MKPVLTHLALGVRDLDRTVAFYRKHARLHVVHERRVVTKAAEQAFDVSGIGSEIFGYEF